MNAKPMNEPTENRDNAPSPVERSLRLLRFIAEGGSTGNISDAARKIGVNRVTLMRLIGSLEAAGMIVEGPRGHRLGMPFLTLAASALGAFDLTTRARLVLPGLVEATRMSAYLVVPEGADIVYVLAQTPDTPLISRIRVGSRLPAWRATPGLAMLARLRSAQLQALCSDAWREDGGPDFDALTQLLEPVRRDGCAWSQSGLEPGIDSCAATILDGNGEPLAALSVAGPSHLLLDRADAREDIAARVKRAADELSASVV